MATRGWKATGLLQPFWNRYKGGRDALAAAVGSTGSALSGVNSGDRNLGHDLARRLAGELGVSVLDLGAPAEAADEEGQSLLDRQLALEAALEQLTKEVRRLARRVADAEKPAQPTRRRGKA